MCAHSNKLVVCSGGVYNVCSKLDTENHTKANINTWFTYILCFFPHNVALEGMVEKLKGKQVSPQLANEFRVCLRLNENDVPADQTDLGNISKKWMLKNTASCSPEALIEALLLTPGLGKFASGIGCKFYLDNNWDEHE